MRILYWFLGAAAASLGGAAVLARQRDRKTAEAFLAAVREGRIEGLVDKPTIGAAGRGGEISGLADGALFNLTMKTDRDGFVRSFVLAWLGRGTVSGTRHVLKGPHVTALAEAYETLAKLRSRTGTPPN